MNELASQLIMEPVQVQQQRPEIHTEVWDSNPQPQWLMRDIIFPAVAENPHHSYSIVFVSESGGGGKGTTMTEGNEAVLEDGEFQGILEAMGKSYEAHYASTASMVRFGIEQGLQKSAYGNPTTDEIDLISRVSDRALQRGESELPIADPDKLHVFWDEFAGVSELLNAGTTIVKRLGKDKHAVVLFMVSNPQIQSLAYEERYELWQAEENVEEVLRNHHSVLDIDPLKARHWMGTHISMERSCAAINQDLFVAFNAGRLQLSEETPYELRRDFEVATADSRDTEAYFRNLTRFADGKMEIAPIRPYLQEVLYYNKAEDWGFLRGHYHVFQPDFVEGDIYGYPGRMAKFAFDWEHYSQPDLEALRQGESL